MKILGLESRKRWNIEKFMIEVEGKKKLVKKVMIIDESVREALSGVMLWFPADSLIMLWKKKKML